MLNREKLKKQRAKVVVYPNVTPFTMMPYDFGPQGIEMKKKHNYKLIKQEGNVVEYEFTFCDDTKCSCHLERYGINNGKVEKISS